MAINEKSALENIDLKTAAYNIVHDFREYRNLGALRRVIENAEKQLEALGKNIREKQQAIATLTYLKRAGFSKKDVKELVVLVRIWNKSMVQGNGNGISSSRKLNTELIDVGTQTNNCNGIFQQPGATNGNLQQPNNAGPGSNTNPQQQQNNVKNGHGSNFSMNDWIRLNLKSNTTNMLNKISG